MMRPPYLYPPILIPDPELLLKYGKFAARLLRLAKNKAKKKGHEHKKRLKELCE